MAFTWWLWKWRNEEVFNKKRKLVDLKLKHLESVMEVSFMTWNNLKKYGY